MGGSSEYLMYCQDAPRRVPTHLKQDSGGINFYPFMHWLLKIAGKKNILSSFEHIIHIFFIENLFKFFFLHCFILGILLWGHHPTKVTCYLLVLHEAIVHLRLPYDFFCLHPHVRSICMKGLKIFFLFCLNDALNVITDLSSADISEAAEVAMPGTHSPTPQPPLQSHCHLCSCSLKQLFLHTVTG